MEEIEEFMSVTDAYKHGISKFFKTEEPAYGESDDDDKTDETVTARDVVDKKE